jgi:single-stranded-DNA-specific exonuclease
MARRSWKPGALRWDIAPVREEAAELARQAGISPLTAGILLGRGIAEAEAVRSFMQPKMTDLLDPLELPGIEAAAIRVAQAVAHGEKIVIYGDYDVDAMTSIAN